MAYVIIASLLVLVPPSVGLANNGDFGRLMCQLGLEYPPGSGDPIFGSTYFHFIRITPSPDRPYLNPLTRIALSIPFFMADGFNACFSQDGFDLRWAGFADILLIGLAVYLWLRAVRRRPLWQQTVFVAAMIFMFADMGYLVYVNSFYAEAAGLAYILLALACLLNLKTDADQRYLIQIAWLGAFFVFALLFGGTKGQNVPLVIPMFLLGIFAARRASQRGLWKIGAIVALVLLIPIADSIRRYDPELLRLNSYNTVFGGLLRYSSDPRRDLIDLGLPPDIARYAGTNPWSPQSPYHDPAFGKAFFPKVSPAKVGLFYARHPWRFAAPLNAACMELPGARLRLLSHFDQHSRIVPRRVFDVMSPGALPPGSRWKWIGWTLFSLWSNFKETCLPNRLWFWAVFGLANIARGIYSTFWGRDIEQKIAGSIRLCLALVYGMVPFIAIVGDGMWDMKKHLFFQGVAFDALALLLILGLLDWLLDRGRRPGQGD